MEDLAAAFARALEAPLAELAGGRRERVRVAKIARIGASTHVGRDGPPAEHFAIRGAACLTASVETSAVADLCDRAFGWSGPSVEERGQSAADLSPCAAMVRDRLGAMLAEAFARALGGGISLEVANRSHRLERILPFSRIAECVAIELSIGAPSESDPEAAPKTESEPESASDAGRIDQLDDDFEMVPAEPEAADGSGDVGSDEPGMPAQAVAPWSISLLAEARPLFALLEALAAKQARPAAEPRPGRTADPSAAPFDGVELELRAELATLRMPLRRFCALSPGQRIALPTRRDVPLLAGDAVLATGRPGALDDQVALRIGGGSAGSPSQPVTTLAPTDPGPAQASDGAPDTAPPPADSTYMEGTLQ